MFDINEWVAIEILNSIKSKNNIYDLKHDRAIISTNLLEMKRAGFIKIENEGRYEDGSIRFTKILITDIGEEFYHKQNK